VAAGMRSARRRTGCVGCRLINRFASPLISLLEEGNTLTDHEAQVLRDFLPRRLGDLSMEISRTGNPVFPRSVCSQRGVPRRMYGAPNSEMEAPSRSDPAMRCV
jgi:hypothetical protein